MVFANLFNFCSTVTKIHEHLREGRHKVLEKNHFLILGWNEKIFAIVRQLIEAQRDNSGHIAVVILADRSKQDMEEKMQSM